MRQSTGSALCRELVVNSYYSHQFTRGHNICASFQPAYGILGQLYVCVLCKYMNGKRRNLYQHLKKKHKISILVKRDGTASCVVEPNASVTVVASAEGQISAVVSLSTP